jgi:signal transduction histidine kinase
VFFILSQYLTRTILSPIEDIGRAAMGLADGEPVVEVPRTGDREIDDLGEFIEKLGESRRQSRVMTSPMDVLIAQSWGHAPKKAEPSFPPADPPKS